MNMLRSELYDIGQQRAWKMSHTSIVRYHAVNVVIIKALQDNEWQRQVQREYINFRYDMTRGRKHDK